ncbi:MAG: DHA2 family efflux MFS transporter permease subunit [Burkholderiales bacterium]|nr:DHA2 family efflux MFS transporter permease subunit [Burkholderiales bacterium]
MPPAAEASLAIEAQFRRYGPAYRWLVTAGGLLGAVSMVLSATMVNVAVPSIMGAFGIGQDLAQWGATAFLATMVASQLLSAWTVEAFGQRTTFCVSLANFTLGALICAAAPSMEMLIVGRILQGFSAGLIQPVVMATVVAVFPVERRGMAVGIYSLGVTLAPSFGPWVGGLAIDAMNWRQIFIVPLPLVAVAFLMGLMFMPSKKLSPRLPSFDWAGFALVALALFCVMSAIGNGHRWGWSSDRTALFFLTGFVAAALFVTLQLRARRPLLDVSLFADLRFTSAMCIAFAFGAGNFATNYAIPVFMQTVQGFTATQAGLVLVPAGVLLVMLTPVVGRMADTLPAHYPLMAGCVLFSVAAWLMSDADVNTAFWTFAGFTILSRVALGMVMPNLGKVAMSSAPGDKLNQAAGTYNFIRQMGGAFGVNLTAVAIDMRTARHADLLAATQTPGNAQSTELLARIAELLHRSGVPDAALQTGALDHLSRVVYAQALALGFQDAFFFTCFAFVLAFVPAWLLGRAGRGGKAVAAGGSLM